jgi:hypothetical protein
MTTNSQARIAVAASYFMMAPMGAILIFSHWFGQSATVAITRSALFLVVMGCVHLAGYMLYAHQRPALAGDVDLHRTSFEFSPLYWPALKFGILLQAIIGTLCALMLDMGETFDVFKVTFVAHWAGIFFIMGRRPLSPTRVDIAFIRWGTPLCLAATVWIRPLVWQMIGESTLSGVERLWQRWSHHLH